MRLWTIHPSYLDAAGLVAAWREGLLAQKVLEGGTRGYARHPQLERFRACPDPARAIERYLRELLLEARARGYSFDESKIRGDESDEHEVPMMEVNEGQIRYELALLEWKLQRRSPADLARLPPPLEARLNGAFARRLGPIEPWERVIEEALVRMRSG